MHAILELCSRGQHNLVERTLLASTSVGQGTDSTRVPLIPKRSWLADIKKFQMQSDTCCRIESHAGPAKRRFTWSVTLLGVRMLPAGSVRVVVIFDRKSCSWAGLLADRKPRLAVSYRNLHQGS